MRLSEDRINAISEKIARHLVRKRLVWTKANLRQLSTWVEKPILDHIVMEDEIDEAVRKYILGLSNPPPNGSADWEALFRKKKEEFAARKNYEI